MKRLAIDLRELRRPGTGIGRWIQNALAARRALAPEIEFVGLGVHHPDAAVSVPGPRGPWTGPTLNRFLARENVGAWLSPYFKLPPRLAVPSLCTVHDTIPAGIWYRALPFIAGLKHALHVADRVATVSDESRKDLVENWGVDPERILMARNAVGPIFSPDALPDDETFLASLGVRSGEYLLVVSDDRPHKNVGILVEAFSGRDTPPILVVGTRRSDLPPPLRRVDVQGDERLAVLYRHARALLHPALQEGFGLPPLEAMACGTDVIVSDIPILREVAGDAGRYVIPTSAEGWRTAVNEVTGSEPRRAANLAVATRYRGEETYAALWAWVREKLHE